MEQMDALYTILEESLELYESFIKVEYDKYDAVIKDDIKKIDEIISKEQVFYLKAKGLEQKREKITNSMNIKDKTLREIIEMDDEEDNSKLKLVYDRLFKVLEDFKIISSECKTLIEVRLHKIEILQGKQNDNTYFSGESQKNNLKSHIVSKRI